MHPTAPAPLVSVVVIGRNEDALNEFANATWPIALQEQKDWFDRRFKGEKKRKENEGALLRNYPWIPYAIAGAARYFRCSLFSISQVGFSSDGMKRGAATIKKAIPRTAIGTPRADSSNMPMAP